MGQLPQRLLERSCLLIYIHRAQQTNSVKQLSHKNKTVLLNIPGAATSIVQLPYTFENYSKNILMKTLRLL